MTRFPRLVCISFFLATFLVVIGCRARDNRAQPTAPSQPASQTPTIPADYRALYDELDKRLDEFSARLNPQSPTSNLQPVFAAELLIANANRGEQLLNERAYQGTLVYLDQLQAMDVRGVKVAIGYPVLTPAFPRFGEYLAFYKKVFQELRRRKMTVLVGGGVIFTDPAYSSLGVNYAGLTWDKYKRERRQQTEIILRELAPNYVTLINEPSTMTALTKLPMTPQHFTEFVNSILNGLDRRGVLVGAGTGNWDDPAYLENLAKNTTVDYIDLHIYPINRGFLPRTIQLADIARANGKRLVIGETWLFKAAEKELGGASDSEIFARDIYNFWQPLDSKFLELMVRFARQNNIEFISPFWSKYFFAYVDYAQTKRGLSPKQYLELADVAASKNIVAGILTETGRTYQRLANTP